MRGLVFEAAAYVLAYPWAIVAIPLVIIEADRNPEELSFLLVMAIAVVGAISLVAPRSISTVVELQRAWAGIVFDLLQMIEMKMVVGAAKRRATKKSRKN